VRPGGRGDSPLRFVREGLQASEVRATQLPSPDRFDLELPARAVGAAVQRLEEAHPKQRHAFRAHPVLQRRIRGRRTQMPEECPPRPDRDADEPGARIGHLQKLVQREGRQVQRRQQRGQMLLPAAENVLEMVVLCFEHAAIFVLDLPARARRPAGRGGCREFPACPQWKPGFSMDGCAPGH
jgi:hypothetical protein